MGEDDFDWGSLFGGGDTDMSNFDMSGLDLGSLADLGGFDIGNLDLGNFDIGDLGNLDLSGVDFGNMDFGDIGDQGIDINSILEGLQTDRVGGQNLDLENFLQNIGGEDSGGGLSEEDIANLGGQDKGAYLPKNQNLESLLQGGAGDEATNVYDQEDMEAGLANQPQSIDDVIRELAGSNYDEDKYALNNEELTRNNAISDNQAVAAGMSPGSAGAQRAQDQNLSDEELAAAYGESGKGSLYDEDQIAARLAAQEAANKPKSIAEAVASGNAPGSVGAKMLASGQLNDEQANALYGTGNGLASLTGVSKNKAIASGTGPSSEGAKMLAEAASNSSSDNAFTPAEEAALFGKAPTNTSTGISKNEAIASGMSPGSAGAKAAAAGDLSDEELAASQGVVTKGSVYNPVTSAEKTADALKKIADAKAAAAKTGATSGSGNNMSQLMMLMALMALMNKSGGGSSSGNATIPSLSAERKQLPYGGGSSSYRPGQGGVTYFTPTTYTTKAAGGGLMSLNGGGHLGGYSDGGHLLRGPGDGVSDSIPATIGGKQPARLAAGEFVVPARIVSELGNGSTDAGAQRLYEMMDRVQHARRKTKNVAADTKAAKYLPA